MSAWVCAQDPHDLCNVSLMALDCLHMDQHPAPQVKQLKHLVHHVKEQSDPASPGVTKLIFTFEDADQVQLI